MLTLAVSGKIHASLQPRDRLLVLFWLIRIFNRISFNKDEWMEIKRTVKEIMKHDFTGHRTYLMTPNLPISYQLKKR